MVYPIATKDESFAKYLEFEKLAESKFKHPIKSLQCDNAREFPGTMLRWKEHLELKGTKLRLTVPYEHYQNGLSERLNRTLLEPNVVTNRKKTDVSSNK